jgi:hypothetical protein
MPRRKPEDKPPLYQFQHARHGLDMWIKAKDIPGLDESWELAKEVIEAQARFYRRYWGEEVARAKAWEDFDIACRGRGAPAISGAVFELWSNVPPEEAGEMRSVITAVLAKSQGETDTRYLRYNVVDRHSPVRTLEDGFCEPEAHPIDFDIPCTATVKSFALTEGIPVSTLPTPETKHETKQVPRAFTVLPGGRDSV